jgi:hypothetical protein
MATVLTETSTFTATVQAPDDGDTAAEGAWTPGLQSLANRTKYLNDTVVALAARVTTLEHSYYWAMYVPTSNSIGATSLLLLSETYDPQAAFSVASGHITVPRNGYYKVTVCLRGTAAMVLTTTRLSLRRGTTQMAAIPLSGETADSGAVDVVRDAVGSYVIQITDSVTQTINIWNAEATAVDLDTTLLSHYIIVEYLSA